MSTTAQRTRVQQRQETRTRVLEAAKHLFLTKGFGDTAVRDVAERAGVSVGHVGHKDALVIQVFESTLPAWPKPGARGTLDAVVGYLDAAVDVVTGAGSLSRQYVAAILRSGHEANQLASFGPHVRRDVQYMLQNAGLSAKDVEGAVDLLELAFWGALAQHLWGSAPRISTTAQLRAAAARYVSS